MFSRFPAVFAKQAGAFAGRRVPALSTRAYSVPNQPEFKREGPTANKHDPAKFDDGRDDTHYQNQQTKMNAMKDDFPNRPLKNTEKGESEMPAGQGGAFADHRGKGALSEGEGSNGTSEAAETRTGARLGQKVKNAASSVFGGSGSSNSFSTFAAVQQSQPKDQHPGYTTADAPIDSSDPSARPAPKEESVPSSSVKNASTKAAPPHPEVQDMAKGDEQPGAGADAKTPTDRSQKVWGANTRSAQFNPGEGERKPIVDGGSNEGGFKGTSGSKSRT